VHLAVFMGVRSFGESLGFSYYFQIYTMFMNIFSATQIILMIKLGIITDSLNRILFCEFFVEIY